MSKAPYYLVLDQGSHASKALIFDGHSEVIAAAEQPIATRQPRPGWVEHDAEEVIASLQEAIREAHAASGLRGAAFAGAGLAIQRSSVVCWDRSSGAPLSPVLSWQDRRNADWLQAQELDSGRLRTITGLVASPHYGASKLRWCLDHLSAVRGAQSAGRLCCGPLASFVLHRLLVERPELVDPANAARTMLWDMRTRDWSREMLEACRIPRECLPRCVPNRHAFGSLCVADLEAPLVVATGDQPAALFAAGEPDAVTLFVNIGTGAFVQQLFPGTAPAVPGLLRGIAWQDAAREISVLEGTVNGAGAALQWLAGERGVAMESLVEAAAGWLEQVANPPVFVNGVGGLGSPYWEAACPIAFSADADLPAETVAVIESIVFLLQANIEALDQAAAEVQRPATRIVVSGGLARLDGLCQRLADLSARQVERPATIEATAQGIAWLLNGVAPPRATPAVFTPHPRPDLQARYRRLGRAIASR